MAPWTAFSHSGDYPFDASRVRKEWRRLHAGDLEPLPEDEALKAASSIRVKTSSFMSFFW